MCLGPDRYCEGLGHKLFDNTNARFIFTILESVKQKQAVPSYAWASQTYTFVTIYSLGEECIQASHCYISGFH